jgi:hypothetical protein
MTAPLAIRPVPYSPAYETPEKDEAQTQAELAETLLSMSRTMYEHTGEALRSVHAKSHGLLRGELEVLDDLPAELRQGLFATARRYPVVARLSTPPAEKLDDRVSLPRAFSLKVVGVEGARLEGSEGDTTQDFLMINGPAFSAGSAKGFLRNLKLLEKTTDKAEGAKEVLSTVMRGANKVLEAVGIESATIKTLGGHPETHPLGETYFTQVPLLYGPYMAKLSLAPVSPSLQLLTDAPIETEDRPDALRDAVTGFFGGQYAGDAEWELRVQLCTDIEKMPLETPDKEWSQEDSPYIPVARLRIPRQAAWDPERVRAIDEGMSFNPWHALAAHRPLGSVMRARRAVYPISAQFRSSHGRCPVMEPRAAEVAAATPPV